ncbi:MAG: hypothetical protein ACK521_09070 [bacterium]
MPKAHIFSELGECSLVEAQNSQIDNHTQTNIVMGTDSPFNSPLLKKRISKLPVTTSQQNKDLPKEANFSG